MNLPVGTVPFYKEPYQGLGSDALSRVRKQFCHPGQEKKNPELNTTGNNDAADTITYSTPIRKVKKATPYMFMYIPL